MQANVTDPGSDGVIGLPTSPMRASGFLSTLGVVTHIPYTDGGYVNLGNVVADLRYLGITQVRDPYQMAPTAVRPCRAIYTSPHKGLSSRLSLRRQRPRPQITL